MACFVADKLLPRMERMAFLQLLALAVLVRLPFYFTSTDGYMRDTAITFHDEAVFMQMGLDVLQGHAPYFTRWDVLAPLCWLVSAVMMLLSFGSLTLFRLIGSVVMAVTAFILFRAMSDSGRRVQGAWAAVFYLLLGSMMQVGQSVTVEHMTGPMIAGIVYILLNPRNDGRQVWRLLALFGLCGQLLPNVLVLAPVIALLYPELYSLRTTPQGRGWRWFGGAAWRALWQVVVRSAMLASMVGAGYMFFYLLYLLAGKGDLYMATLLEAPQVLQGSRMGVWEFWRNYVVKLARSDHWLMVACGGVFAIKLGKAVLLRQRMDPLLPVLALLMLAGLGMVYLRGNNTSLFGFYFLQVLPFFALMIGTTLRFDYDEARWFVAGAVALGLYHSALPLLTQYSGLARYMAGDNSQHESWYNDRLYRVAKTMQRFPTRGETLVVCGEDDMLYLLTGMVNPRYYLFPFYHYNGMLHGKLKQDVPSLRQLVTDTKPLYIVGRDNDPLTRRGFSEISDIMNQKYIAVANVDSTIVYLRRDKLRGIFQ